MPLKKLFGQHGQHTATQCHCFEARKIPNVVDQGSARELDCCSDSSAKVQWCGNEAVIFLATPTVILYFSLGTTLV